MMLDENTIGMVGSGIMFSQGSRVSLFFRRTLHVTVVSFHLSFSDGSLFFPSFRRRLLLPSLFGVLHITYTETFEVQLGMERVRVELYDGKIHRHRN